MMIHSNDSKNQIHKVFQKGNKYEWVYNHYFKKCLINDEAIEHSSSEKKIQQHVKSVAENQSKYLDFLNQVAQYPNNFKAYVETQVNSDLLSVENQQFYLNVFIKNNNTKAAKLKI